MTASMTVAGSLGRWMNESGAVQPEDRNAPETDGGHTDP
jgi:hypothetical protein